jgi:hypothetical protein
MNTNPPTRAAIPFAWGSSYACSNGAYDANGNLLFYVQDLYVLSATSGVVGYLPTYSGTGVAFNIPAPEVEIVKVPGSGACNVFYVIYTLIGFPGGFSLDYVKVDCTSGFPIMSVPTNSKLMIGDGDGQGLAVSKLTTNNKRYLFTIDNAVVRYTIDSTGISSPTTIVTSAQLAPYNQLNNWTFLCELQLSSNQLRLSWTGAEYGGATVPVFEVTLNSSYNYAGQFYTYSLPRSVGHNFVYGIAYTANSGKLYATTDDGVYYLTPGSTSGITYIPGSANYGSTQLQLMASTGYIIGVDKSGVMYKIDPSFNMISPNYGNAPPLISNNTPNTSLPREYRLPDQIDGDTPDPVPTLTASVTAKNSSLCPGNSVVATGTYSGSATPGHYYWEIDQCSDQYGNGAVLLWSQTYNGAPPSAPFTFPNSSTLPCGHWYKIVFKVENTAMCLGWATTSAMIYINCNPAPVITGNLNVCSGDSTTLCENYPYNSQYDPTWVYHVGTKVVDVDAQCITVTPTANTVYGVSVVDHTTGCSGSASVTVTVSKDIASFNLSDDTTNSGYATISALANSNVTVNSAGYGYMYIVEELTSYPSGSQVWIESNNPCYWWNFPNATRFNNINNAPSNLDYAGTVALPTACGGCVPGTACTSYPVGKFRYGNIYRITLGSWSNACPWTQSSQIIVPAYGSMKHASGNKSASLIMEDNAAPDFSYLRGQSVATKGELYGSLPNKRKIIP